MISDREKRLYLEARLAAFGSPEVRGATQDFFAAEDRFADAFPDGRRWDDCDQAVADARTALGRVETLVRDELDAYSSSRVRKSV
jgi:hypothetical protein